MNYGPTHSLSECAENEHLHVTGTKCGTYWHWYCDVCNNHWSKKEHIVTAHEGNYPFVVAHPQWKENQHSASKPSQHVLVECDGKSCVGAPHPAVSTSTHKPYWSCDTCKHHEWELPALVKYHTSKMLDYTVETSYENVTVKASLNSGSASSSIEKYFRCSECDEIHSNMLQAAQCCLGCSTCEENPCLCETKSEDVGHEAGLDPHLNLPQLCADYYLLLNLSQTKKHVAATEKVKALAEMLAPQFETYLDLAIGGELRFFDGNPTSFGLPAPPFPMGGGHYHRGLAWLKWQAWKSPTFRAEYASSVFGEWPGGGFGGEAWKDIADGLLLRVRDNLDAVKWLDRVWNLQHNGGCALDKWGPWSAQVNVYDYESHTSGGLVDVLNAHGKDHYEILLQHASTDVQNLWAAVVNSFDFQGFDATVIGLLSGQTQSIAIASSANMHEAERTARTIAFESSAPTWVRRKPYWRKWATALGD